LTEHDVPAQSRLCWCWPSSYPQALRRLPWHLVFFHSFKLSSQLQRVHRANTATLYPDACLRPTRLLSWPDKWRECIATSSKLQDKIETRSALPTSRRPFHFKFCPDYADLLSSESLYHFMNRISPRHPEELGSDIARMWDWTYWKAKMARR